MTEQGIYIGQHKVWNGTPINYWFGIPYAQQPINQLRWKPPQLLGKSNETRYANVSNACPQQKSFEVLYTESCLTLNVYTPVNATNLPVYVWIHGGSFLIGSGIFYDATQIMSTSIQYSSPIIVVTINYRLGLLGFLADQELYDESFSISNHSTTGNYGVLDQIMALGWIKNNIQGFGGDPMQITIGGESAGGISVTTLLTSPLIKTNSYQRAIVQSGSIWPSFAIPLSEAIHERGFLLRLTTNCTTLLCMRNLTLDQLLMLQDLLPVETKSGMIASPVIDGYVLRENMETSYLRGNFQKVPILIGSNSNETSLFTCPLFNNSANTTEVQNVLKTLYNDTIINEISLSYGSIYTYMNPLTYLNIIYSDSWAHCGSRRIASSFSNYVSSVYLYTYNHVLSITPACIGTFHIAELLMLFPNLLHYLYPTYNFNLLEQNLSTRIMLHWIHFIRNSDPNYDDNMTVWTKYQPSLDNDILIDIDSEMRSFYYNQTCTNVWDKYAIDRSFL